MKNRKLASFDSDIEKHIKKKASQFLTDNFKPEFLSGKSMRGTASKNNDSESDENNIESKIKNNFKKGLSNLMS